ncbi:MAG: Uncharacterised protein [Cellulomonadaceae bacterium TMED98]|nr:MAG: Uncharacterised protein [Cellulomonadaceae bacterium TMED98]
MQSQRRNEDGGKKHDVKDVQARYHLIARELITEEQIRNPDTDNGESFDHSVNNSQAVTGEQVVRQRVSGKTFCHCEDEQDKTDHPVQFTRLAERAREEHPQHVQAGCGDEEQGSPVMRLSHQQSAPDVKREVERGVVGDGHLHALQRKIRAFVFDFGHRRVIKERQESAGD